MTESSHILARAATSAVVYAMYRSVEVRRPDADFSDRPVIIAANHSGGFFDPVLLMYGLDRRPRFLAKATFWDTPLVGKFFDTFGVLPVHRATDGSTEGNVEVFEACHRALRNREIIAVFPEGKITEGPTIGDLRTGTARIALGARESGATGIVIVPVGLHYEERSGVRGRIFARVGEPIDLDEELERYVAPGDPTGEENHDAVRALTADIEARLREAAPNYASDEERTILSAAAQVAVRADMYDPSAPVSYGRREELATRIRAASGPARAAVTEAVSTYADLLTETKLNDITVATFSQVGGALPDFTVRSFAAAVALSPSAAVGVVANAVPVAAMSALRANLRVNPLMRATIRTVAAPIVYSASWTIAGALLRRRGVRFGQTVAWSAGAVGGWALLLTNERIQTIRDGLSGWIRIGDEGPPDDVKAARQALIDAVAAATG